MNKKNAIKNGLLRKKIKEYFSKNPSSKSVVIHAGFGDSKTIWRVVRGGKSFNVTEVNTNKEEYILEDKTVAGGKGGKPFQYDPEQKPGGTLPPGQGPVAAKPIGQDIPNGPATPPQQSMSQWDPNNPTGMYQKLAKSVGAVKAMMAMPEPELKKHFGYPNKQYLMKTLQATKGAAAKGQAVGMQQYGSRSPAAAQTNDLNNPQESAQMIESPEFGRLSTQFAQAMAPPFDHTKLSNTLKSANSIVGRITDPKERGQIGAMIGALTQMVDATTAGGGSQTQLRGARPVTNVMSPNITAGRKLLGKLIREFGEEEKKSTKTKKKEPEKTSHKLDPTTKPADDDPAIETNTDFEDPEQQQDEPVKQPSSEEMVIGRNLSGQTIKSANITLTPSGGELSLDLVSATAPAKLQWTKTGKVVWYFNDRPYVLKRD